MCLALTRLSGAQEEPLEAIEDTWGLSLAVESELKTPGSRGRCRSDPVFPFPYGLFVFSSEKRTMIAIYFFLLFSNTLDCIYSGLGDLLCLHPYSL